MDNSDKEMLKLWKQYIDGFPAGFPIYRLEEVLGEIAKIKLNGIGREVHDEIAKMITAKIEELRATQQNQGESK